MWIQQVDGLARIENVIAKILEEAAMEVI